jgi:hypothetical protein
MIIKLVAISTIILLLSACSTLSSQDVFRCKDITCAVGLPGWVYIAPDGSIK